MFGRGKRVHAATPAPAPAPVIIPVLPVIVYPSDALIAFARRIMYRFNSEQVDSGYMDEEELQTYIDCRTVQFRAMTQDVLALRLLRDMDATAFHSA